MAFLPVSPQAGLSAVGATRDDVTFTLNAVRPFLEAALRVRVVRQNVSKVRIEYRQWEADCLLTCLRGMGSVHPWTLGDTPYCVKSHFARDPRPNQ